MTCRRWVIAFAVIWRVALAQQCQEEHTCSLCRMGTNSDSHCCHLPLVGRPGYPDSIAKMRVVTTTDDDTGSCISCNAECLDLAEYQVQAPAATQAQINSYCDKCGGAASGELTKKEVDEVLYKTATVSTYAQMICKEFFLVIWGVRIEENSQRVRSHLEILATNLDEVINDITNMTGATFQSRLMSLKFNYDAFKTAIVDSGIVSLTTTTATTTTGTTLSTTTTTTTRAALNLLNTVSLQSKNIMEGGRDLSVDFRDYAASLGFVYFIQREFINRNRILTQEMGKSAILRGLGRIMPQGYSTSLAVRALVQLLNAMDYFTETHYGFLRGETWVRSTIVTDNCILMQTMEVSYYYEEQLVPELRKVIYRLAMDAAVWNVLDAATLQLLSVVETTIPMLDVAEEDPTGNLNQCDIPARMAEGGFALWRKAMKQVGNERRLVQEMARIYFQIAKDYQRVGRIERLTLRYDTFRVDMRKAIEGSRVDMVPPPPTQALADNLITVLLDEWRPVEEIYKQAVAGKTAVGGWDGVDNQTLLLLESRTRRLDGLFEEISMGYADTCVFHRPDLPCYVLDRVTGLSTAYERLTKYVWLMSLFPNSTEFYTDLNYTMYNLTAETLRLVNGVPPFDRLPRTRNVCILNELRQMRTSEGIYIEAVENVVQSGNFSMYMLEMVTNLYFSVDGNLMGETNDVLELYSQDSPVCNWLNQKTAGQWREGMAAAGRLPALMPKVAKEFFLVEKLRDLHFPQRSLMGEEHNRTLVDSYIPDVDLQMQRITLGSLDRTIPSAPMQEVDDLVFAAQDKWFTLRDKITGTYARAQVEPITNYVYGLTAELAGVVDAYVMFARRCNIEDSLLEPTVMEKTGLPLTYIELMTMEAMLLALWEGSGANLTKSMDNFERAITALQEDAQGQACRVWALEEMKDTWSELKPDLQLYIDTATYVEKQVLDTVNVTDALYAKALEMQSYFTASEPTCSLESKAFGASPQLIFGLTLMLSFFH